MLSVFDKGPFAPCPSPFNMAAYVLAAGPTDPEKDALLVVSSEGIERWSYASLRAAILGTGQGLLNQGLVPGDTVLMRLGNTVDFPIAYLGALAVGIVPVPTSPALTEPETAFAMGVTLPAAVLRDPDIVCAPCDKTISLNQLRGFRALPPATFHMGDPNRMAYIIFTSGTSGTPRAVAHAHRAIWARQMMFDGWYGLRASDRVLHAGAFNWTFTLGTGLMDPWTKGATALIASPGTNPAEFPCLIREHSVTVFAAAPGVYRQMLNGADKVDLPALRHGLSAGEKLPQATAARWQSVTGRPVFEAYGMSECSTFISQAPDHPVVPGTLGCPQVGRRIALIDNGTPVSLGEEGTIAIHRDDPGLMLGYLGAPGATADRMVGDWFLTGDQAVMGADSILTYMGRNDDMMNAGGYRVSPIEVETALSHYPGITAVAVTAVEVKKDTQVIAAFYTGPELLDDTDLQLYVSGKLARYKQPRLFIHLPELPMGANGKILRRVLRADFERPT